MQRALDELLALDEEYRHDLQKKTPIVDDYSRKGQFQSLVVWKHEMGIALGFMAFQISFQSFTANFKL